MTIALRSGVTKGTQAGGTSTSATVCTNVNGDILRLSVKVQGDTTVTVTGWTLIGNRARSTDFGVYEFWREASSEPGSYTINFGASVTYVDWIMRAYSGVDLVTPIDSANVQFTSGATFGNYVVPAYSVTNNNSLVTISVCAVASGQTAPNGGTATQVEQQDDAGTLALTCYDDPRNAGSVSSESRTGVGYCVGVVTLNEATAAGAPTDSMFFACGSTG